MKRILNISSDDYANFSHDNAKALRSVGVNCVDVKTIPHIFKYPSESQIKTLDQIRELAKSFDIIQIFHSDLILLNKVVDLGKELFVYHTGSRYRERPERFNLSFNPFVKRSFIALGEFSGLGSKNETYIVGAVDFDSSLMIPDPLAPYTVGHFPSSEEVKGTKEILDILETDVKNDFILNYSSEKVIFEKQMRRLEDCDIYIELFKPSLNGKKYGSFGITALEAASLGKVVITQNLSADVYEKHYGKPEIFLVESREDLIYELDFLLSLNPEDLKLLQVESRRWILKKHSHEATGARLKNILGI